MKATRKVVTFHVGLDAFGITQRRLCAAMQQFDRLLRAKEPSSGTKFAVLHDGKRYPPKRILGLAIGRPNNPFAGGKNTNGVFESLGFKVVSVGHILRPPASEERTKLRRPAPRVAELTGRVFSQRWVNLHTDLERLDEIQYPGIYALAYSGDDLRNERVQEKHVYYVGMSSHAGVKSRLKQFIKGLEDGGHHSGAKRFFNEVANRVPYTRYKDKQTFYVAAACVPCVSLKAKRTPLDLKKMGVVVAAEQNVLARIRQKTGHEPGLNKK